GCASVAGGVGRRGAASDTAQSVEDLAVEQLIAKAGVEVLAPRSTEKAADAMTNRTDAPSATPLRHHGRRPGRGGRDRKTSNCRLVPARRHARTGGFIFPRLLRIISAQYLRSSRCRKTTGPVLNSCFSD